MNTATLIKAALPDYRGDAALYRLDPPLDGVSLVVVSAVNDPDWFGIHETFIFPADAEGEIVDFAELHGSTRGTTSHAEALENAGYTIVGDGQ